jgi:hypothetical protein
MAFPFRLFMPDCRSAFRELLPFLSIPNRYDIVRMAVFIVFCGMAFVPTRALAQDSNSPAAQQETSPAGMRMDIHMPTNVDQQNKLQLPSPHEGSGTGWQPASVAGPEWMWMRGGWMLMAHGVIFTDYNQQGGPRGEGKAESVNWGMLMEQHQLGKGTILFRQMFSAESLTSPHPGFPELFQTGETYHGEPLVDHQHPHNVFAELSLFYTVPLGKRLSWEFYGGPSAEPALGPVTYIHRASAAELPLAPLSHHLQDSTHTSFGVVTTGFIIDGVKLEASAFNGHEPNEERWSIQLRGARLLVHPGQRGAGAQLDGAIQHWPTGTSGGTRTGRPVATDSVDRIQPAAGYGELGDDTGLGPRARVRDRYQRECYESERLSAGIDVEFPAAKLCLLAAGAGRQGRAVSRGAGASRLPDWSLHVRRGTGLDATGHNSRSFVATWTGSGCDGLLEARRARCDLW